MPNYSLENTNLESLVSLAKRRGFIFQSSEIYGGLSSTWDYGPIGVELKRNIKEQWWKSFVTNRQDIVGIDASILMHPSVWEASGHLSSFSDPLVECKICKKRFREDLIDGNNCPECDGDLGESRQFNLMFKTFMGPLENDSAVVYLRPETAQAMFVNFDNVQTTSRKKIPFGIAQIGKSFRNEITPGNFTYRTREFEQMEMEFFCKPGEDEEWHKYWIEYSYNWFHSYGIRKEKLRIREHSKDELPHYSKGSSDIEFKFPWGWGELETISNRTDYDLKAHSNKSGKDLTYFDQSLNERYFPFVVEPAMGADRSSLAFLSDSYDEEGEGKDKRTVLRFHPDIAPVTVAVLPLSRNEKLIPMAKKIYESLLGKYNVEYDDSQSIGRRYRRQDEIGTPLCVTIDFETIEKDNSVTIRNRDSMEQKRININQLIQGIDDHIKSIINTFI